MEPTQKKGRTATEEHEAPLKHNCIRPNVLEDLLKFSKGELKGTSTVLLCGSGISYVLLQLNKVHNVHVQVIDMGLRGPKAAHLVLEELKNSFLAKLNDVPHVIVLDHVEYINEEYPGNFFKAMHEFLLLKRLRLVLSTPDPEDAYRIVGSKAAQKSYAVSTMYCSFRTQDDAAYAICAGFATRYLEAALMEMASLAKNRETHQMVVNKLSSLAHDVASVYRMAWLVRSEKEKGLNAVLCDHPTRAHTVDSKRYLATSHAKLGRGLLWLGRWDETFFQQSLFFVKQTAYQHTITDRAGNKMYVWNVPIERGIQTLATLIHTSNDIDVRTTTIVKVQDKHARREDQAEEQRSYFTQIFDNLSMARRHTIARSERPTDPDVIEGIATNLIKACENTLPRKGTSQDQDSRDIEIAGIATDLLLWEFQPLRDSAKGVFAEELQEGHEYIVEHISSALSLDIGPQYRTQITPHMRKTFHTNRLSSPQMSLPLTDSLEDALRKEWMR